MAVAGAVAGAGAVALLAGGWDGEPLQAVSSTPQPMTIRVFMVGYSTERGLFNAIRSTTLIQAHKVESQEEGCRHRACTGWLWAHAVPLKRKLEVACNAEAN
jgi:hypothetical protein